VGRFHGSYVALSDVPPLPLPGPLHGPDAKETAPLSQSPRTSTRNSSEGPSNDHSQHEAGAGRTGQTGEIVVSMPHGTMRSMEGIEPNNSGVPGPRGGIHQEQYYSTYSP
jgi:hypothetical protein